MSYNPDQYTEPQAGLEPNKKKGEGKMELHCETCGTDYDASCPQCALTDLSERERNEAELANWIETEIISRIIFEELEAADIELSLENAKTVYLDILGDALYDAIRNCINYNPAFADHRSGFDPVRTPEGKEKS